MEYLFLGINSSFLPEVELQNKFFILYKKNYKLSHTVIIFVNHISVVNIFKGMIVRTPTKSLNEEALRTSEHEVENK